MSLFYANRFVASLTITALIVTSGLTPGVAMASDAQVKSTYNVQSTQSSINTLTRLGGYDRYGTAVQIADHGWQSASTAVLAPSGDRNMVDALASSSLAKAVDGPILLADIDSVPSSTMTELKKLGVTKVYLVSGTAVISAKVESDLTAAGVQSIRLGGYDRYETAVNIAKEIQKVKPFQEVVVTNAYANVDAISIAPIAAAKGIPVLLVDKGSVPKVVSDFIGSSGISKTYVIGGTAVVSNSVKDALPNAMRLGGNDRFDTNTEVLKQFENLIVGGSMFFANGSDTSLIDSLTGAPMAAKFGGAIVLSNKDAVPVGTKGFIQTDISLKNPVILGGTAVMSDSAVQSLGYAQPGQSAILNGAVELNTPNATFKDKTVNGNILVDADGITLQNVIVNGTIFVDPGKDGSATLDGVQATRIVVLSGADHSIHMKNTKSDSLVVSSSSPGTHVVAESGTTLGSTLVQSNASIESQSGANVGILTAQPRLETPIAVGLQGTFSNDVALSGSVKLTAEAGAVVSNVTVANAASPEAIQFAGQFASVSITDSSPVTIVSGTVATMATATASSIVVNQGAAVTSLSSSAGSATLSGGGTVNGNVTTATPTSSTIPVTPAPAPTPAPTPTRDSTSTVAVSAITVTGTGGAITVVNGGTLQMSATVKPDNATNKTVTWSVTNGTDSAIIDATTGLLKATGVGTVTVKATNAASGVVGELVVTVTSTINVTYYTGIDFKRSNSPITDSASGKIVSQEMKGDGSIGITVTSPANTYVDSGFVMNAGTLGELDSIAVNGTGDYGLNLYFDLNGGGFFNWGTNGTFKDVGGDAYALYEGPFENTVTISGSSSFGLQGQPSGSKYLYPLDELKDKYPASTPIGIWVGVTRGGSEAAGSKSAVINSVTVTKKTVYSGADARAYVQPQDFSIGKWSGVSGYNVGFQLQTQKATGLAAIEVSLYKDSTLLVTNTSKPALLAIDTAQLSSPFNVNGSFSGDDYWTYGTWPGSATLVPTKAVIKVTAKDGKTYIVENSTLTGDPSTIFTAVGLAKDVAYYTGIDFKQLKSPITDNDSASGRNVSQEIKEGGSIGITVTSPANTYLDSGFVMNAGTLGELDSIAVNGTGDYSLNLYFDVDGGGFFNWNANGTFGNVGGDAYALYEGPFENTVTISGSSSFGLQRQPSGSKYLYTLDELKVKYPSTPIGIWVGVTRGGEAAGSKSAVINSVTVTKKTG